ncbi:MAG TPA: CHAT domain-containing protein [Leadbetterella sp.]|nr:CHAT domain-containing protein [Leadbetterella sp.]
MKLKLLSILSIFLVGLAVSQPGPASLAKEYERGLSYFNLENPTEYTDNQAIKSFEKIAKHKPQNKTEAVWVGSANEKLGVLLQGLGDLAKAKKYYKSSLKVSEMHGLVDTLSFRSNLYLSGLYYYESVYDSCLFFLEKAEQIIEKYPKLGEAERLFNTKGVLLFEAGNFRQSLVYFKKAEQQIGTDEFTNRNNQALALQFLNQRDSTLRLLKSLESRFPNEEQLKINLASVLTELNKPLEALIYLKNLVGDSAVYYNALGKVYLKLGDLGKSKVNFEKTIHLQKGNLADKGFAYYFLGKIAAENNKPYRALYYYQVALGYLDSLFYSKNIFHNPVKVDGSFSSFFLLNILAEKVGQFEKLYRKTKDVRYLRGAMRAFEAYEMLANTLSKNYTQENARLDLLARIQPVYQSFVRLLVEGFSGTQNHDYIKQAFEVSEGSKALVLSLAINENQLKNTTDIPAELLQNEQNLQIALAALRRNLQNSSDTDLTKKYLQAINETEIKLDKLNQKLEKYPKFKAKKLFENQRFTLRALQDNLSAEELVISYFDMGRSAVVFGVSSSDFKFRLITNVANLNHHLRKVKSNVSQKVAHNSLKVVYSSIFKPFNVLLKDKPKVVFVGDAEANGLPMEVLKDTDGAYLLQSHTISYLFSSKFVLSSKEFESTRKVLAFAPFSEIFSGKDYLPNSKDEIANISSARPFFGKSATKSNFMSLAASYPILHLATHAVAYGQFPEKSFIRFANDNQKNDKLYLFEFSAGMLKNTQLVFLSACDSYGNFNLKGEGIRGLSRGFYLAGSQCIISSLWKAEDYATAYLTRRFYKHVGDGQDYPEALREAKLDLLEDRQMVQFRDPKYWSHLVFVGHQKKNKWASNGLNAALGSLFLALFIWFLLQKNALLKPKA